MSTVLIYFVARSAGFAEPSTFATLNCSYLLKAFTSKLFVVTSEVRPAIEAGTLCLASLLSALR